MLFFVLMSNKNCCCFAFFDKQCCFCKVIQLQLCCCILKQGLYLQQFHYPFGLNVDEWLHIDVCSYCQSCACCFCAGGKGFYILLKYININKYFYKTKHITNTAWSCILALFNINKIRPFLSEHASLLLVQALVLFRLDYCMVSWQVFQPVLSNLYN